MYLVFTLYLLAYKVRVTVDGRGLVVVSMYVMSFKC